MNAFPPPPSKLCHLYRRVSSGIQLEGTGLERQYENTTAYIERHGLELVRTYSDRGVSAFRGKNRRVGELALILRHIETGIIRSGEHLIIESVDRLSRQDPLDALDTFREVLRLGIIVHNVYEGTTFTLDDLRNMGKLTGLLYSMGRANEESRYKSSRVADAHAKARVNGTIVAGSIPSWLSVKKDGNGAKRFTVKRIEAKIVKRMFEMCANGLSSYEIAKRLTADKIKPFGVARRRIGSKSVGLHHWNATSILDILKGRSVLGEHKSYTTSYDPQTGKRILTLASTNPSYYEPIISPDLWQRANDALKSRLKARSRGRTGATFANVLKDVVVCDHCQNSMHIKVQYEHGTRNRYTRLRCSGRSENICSNAKMPRYLAVEAAILEFVSEIDLKDGRAEDVAALDRVIAADTMTITNLDTKIRSIIKAFTGSPVAIEMVREMEAEKAVLQENVAANRSRRDAIASRESPSDRKAALRALRDRMASETGADLYATRAALNMKVKDAVDKIAFRKAGPHIVMLNDGGSYLMVEGEDGVMKVFRGVPVTTAM